MSLDLSKLGYQTGIHEFNYDWKTVILYALGVGAKQDELGYLYEGFGPSGPRGSTNGRLVYREFSTQAEI